METNVETPQKFIDLFPEVWMNARKPEQEISLRIYQHLANKVHPNEQILSAELPYSEDEIRNILEPLKAGIYRDDSGDIIGFAGLTTHQMAHSIRVNDITTYTWCALDALFIPELLGKPAVITSADPVSKKAINFKYTGNQFDTEGSGPLVSLVRPNAEKLTEDVISNFCHLVHFFESTETGKEWSSSRPDTYLVSLDDALQIAHLMNRTRYNEFIK